MKLLDLLAEIPFESTNVDLNLEITSLSRDSRTIQTGALFAALEGETHDGHDYISKALDRGAAAVLCQKAPRFPGPWIVVEDSRAAYAMACANWFGNPARKLRLVAVTGTNGKTTTTSLLHELISGVKSKKVGLIGTNRCLIGTMELPAQGTTPDSYTLHSLLRRMKDAGCRYVVMEASSHALEQRRLWGLSFEVGVFTNLTQDHLDYHRTMEAYRAAKLRLFA